MPPPCCICGLCRCCRHRLAQERYRSRLKDPRDALGFPFSAADRAEEVRLMARDLKRNRFTPHTHKSGAAINPADGIGPIYRAADRKRFRYSIPRADD